MIETKNLTKKFGDLTAVADLTLRVEEGEVFGLLGPNGAGKTTTVRMLACLISKTSGTATVGNFAVGVSDDSDQIRRTIGLLPENAGLYDDLSAYKNLDYYGRLYELTEGRRHERIESLLKMLDLWEKRDSRAGTFSKGMKQKLAIARTLLHDPRILFLDEPTANLDPESSKAVRDFIGELKKEGRTVFVNTHNLDEAEKICDRIGIMKTRLIAVGPTKKMLESLWGRRTVIQMARVSDDVLAAVKKLLPGRVVVEGNMITVDVGNPEKENPEIIGKIVSAGGQIQFVTELLPTLEEVYMKLVGS